MFCQGWNCQITLQSFLMNRLVTNWKAQVWFLSWSSCNDFRFRLKIFLHSLLLLFVSHLTSGCMACQWRQERGQQRCKSGENSVGCVSGEENFEKDRKGETARGRDCGGTTHVSGEENFKKDRKGETARGRDCGGTTHVYGEENFEKDRKGETARGRDCGGATQVSGEENFEKEKLLEEEIVEEPPTFRRVNPQKRVIEKTRQKSVGPAEKRQKLTVTVVAEIHHSEEQQVPSQQQPEREAVESVDTCISKSRLTSKPKQSTLTTFFQKHV